MDKIYYFVHHACAAVAKSVAVLNDETLFGPIKIELKSWLMRLMNLGMMMNVLA